EQNAAEPHPEETADLVTEESKAVQHGKPTGAEHQGHQAGGWWDSRQPQQPANRTERDRCRRTRWQGDEPHYRERAAEINRGDNVALRKPPPERAREQAAHDIENTNHANDQGANLGRKPATNKVG